jgi:hypothetical protein
MPTYEFQYKDKQEEPFEKYFSSWRDKDEYLKNNENVEQVIGAPSIVSGVSGNKPDDGFRDVLKNIKRRAGRRSNINTW